jgi:hypothetical protein
VATEGCIGIYIQTRNYGATAAFWKSLGYESAFETDHGSGQWQHPGGGPYLFIDEQPTDALAMHLILGVKDAAAFSPDRPADFAKPFTPEHWGMLEAVVLDPDGRHVSLQAPLSPGAEAPDADAHHAEKYG